jgi:ATP-dependent Lhr-like helicase
VAAGRKSRSKQVNGSTASPDDSLNHFLPFVADWFRNSLGTPTDAQSRGWNSIRAGSHTLIVAPTGSGKTLAAFLAGLDELWRRPERPRGVQILYLSPLKALSQDIRRNLERPLQEVAALATAQGSTLPPIRAAVRTGDTPTSERQAQARKPPDILITTPESLHLILGSAARSILLPVRWVIVDELHAMAGQKRGTFLALLLERLVEETGREPLRIGLTATVNPLESAAQFLGGHHEVPAPGGNSVVLEPRPVTIVRSIEPKAWDLLVRKAEVEDAPGQPRSIWPKLEKDIVALIAEHRSTLVFANDRFGVERLTARINELVAESVDDGSSGDDAIASSETASVESEPVEETVDDMSGWVRAHHGSIALERRRKIENDLKEGRLKGVVCTASLEMGIDMGAVDLVCQVGSPGEVSRGLQRVGRAGHAVGQVSKGRFFTKSTSDLLETAALVRAMSRGEVEPLAIPRNCLDILAQQVVACVAVRTWKPRELLRVLRRSEPFRNLSEKAFESVLDMVSGRFRVEAVRDLKARIFWDRVRDELVALPGTSSMALTGGGAITDTGQYPVRLGDGGPTLGTLDEEFVLERRTGEAFRLGSSTWRIDRIDPDKVIVSPAEGRELAVMPFWRGEGARRSATLGRAIGELVRTVAERPDDASAERTLAEECRLEPSAARELKRLIDRQIRLSGAAPDDRTIVVEAFRDPSGEVALAVLSPWGGRFHQALKLVLQSRIEERLGIRPAAQHADDGLIMRLPSDVDNRPPLDLLDDLSFVEAERRLQAELADSALFGLRFRQNASRALLLPRPDPGKRTPLWLQRLRSKDLLGIVRQMPEFPIVVETYRECLSQDLDLELLKTVLDGIADGSMRIAKHAGEAAGPFAADLMNRFERKFLYEWDDPHKNGGRARPGQQADLPQGPLLDELLDPRVVERLGRKVAEAVHQTARSAEDLAERLGRLGDLADDETTPENLAFLEELESRGLCRHVLPEAGPGLWVLEEEFPLYCQAFPDLSRSAAGSRRRGMIDDERQMALDHVLTRFVRSRALIGLSDLTRRYPIESSVAVEWLARWTENGGFTRIKSPTEAFGEATVWAETGQVRQLIGQSLAERRRDVKPIGPEVWAAWVTDQGFEGRSKEVLPDLAPIEELERLLLPLQGWAATPREWAEEILPARSSRPLWDRIDDLMIQGGWSWRTTGEADRTETPRIVFFRNDMPQLAKFADDDDADAADSVARTLRESLANFGPATASELAARSGVSLAAVKSAIRYLLFRGYVTNDRVRFLERFLSADRASGGESATSAKLRATGSRGRKLDSFRSLLIQQGVGVGGRGPGRAARTTTTATEGRWRLLERAEASSASAEERLAFVAALVMSRYGVVCRETVSFGVAGVNWSEIVPWLEAAEWRGELRRGYFVEGLSGMQFTSDDIARDLEAVGETLKVQGSKAHLAIRWISAVDPSNVIGSTAPLDLPLVDGGKARLPRIAGNSLVMAGGLPVWIVQERGKRLTSLPHASFEVRKLSLECLVRNFTKMTPKWTIATLDDAPAATTEWAEVLTEAGFFRDGLALTIYRGLV